MVSPVFICWCEIGGDVMTNEELALKIQNGERNLIPTLWEQVERYTLAYAGEICELDPA